MQEYDLYKAIERIRVRTGLYIGDQTLSNIASYLGGYIDAMCDAGIKKMTYPDFAEFGDWIKKKYDLKNGAAGWQIMILALVIGCDSNGELPWGRLESATEAEHLESVRLFFELVDEYRKSMGSPISRR